MVDLQAASVPPRPHLANLRPVPHGSVPAAELACYGLTLADVLDFSVSTNPLGAAPVVAEALRRADWNRYPGDDEAPLRARLAERCGVGVEQVVLGNGSAEILWLVALAFLGPDAPAAILGPTFGEYARAAAVVGAPVMDARDAEPAREVRVLFVCNPNNPTGLYLSADAVARLLADVPRRLLVLDEAYAPFVEQRWSSEPLLASGNLVLLRSLTKDHGIAGARLGYALASPQVAAALESVRPPWSVNAGALRAGLAALAPEGDAHMDRAREVVRASRSLLLNGFRRLGYEVEPPGANFLLVNVGDAAAFRMALLPRGLVVRDGTSFGLPRYVRVACRLPAECQRLLDTVEEVWRAP